MPQPVARRPGGSLLAALTAGIAIVGAAALVVRRIRPSASAAAGHTTRRVPGPAVHDGEGLAVVLNAAAGSGSCDAVIEPLHDALPRARVVEVDGESIEQAIEAAAGAAVLGIAGGDGSVNAVAEAALNTDRPLAVFPGGTLNHFARALGIAEAADTVAALQGGDLVAVDVGTIGGRPFLNTASFGSYAEFVDAREKLEDRIGKWPAALVAAAVVLRRTDALRVELDGVRRTVWMIFIGNCEYQPPGLAPSTRARLDDGRFDVRYVEGSEPFSRLRFLGALALGRLTSAKVYTRTVVESLDVHSLDGPLRLARDGETFDGGVDVRIEKHPQSLAVYAPHG